MRYKHRNDNYNHPKVNPNIVPTPNLVEDMEINKNVNTTEFTKDTNIEMDIYIPNTLTPNSENLDDSYLDMPQSTYQHNCIPSTNTESKAPSIFSQLTPQSREIFEVGPIARKGIKPI